MPLCISLYQVENVSLHVLTQPIWNSMWYYEALLPEYNTPVTVTSFTHFCATGKTTLDTRVTLHHFRRYYLTDLLETHCIFRDLWSTINLFIRAKPNAIS